MNNQDDVARKLFQLPARDMHLLMVKHVAVHAGTVSSCDQLVLLESTTELLVSNGWTLKEYADECGKPTLLNHHFRRAFSRYA